MECDDSECLNCHPEKAILDDDEDDYEELDDDGDDDYEPADGESFDGGFGPNSYFARAMHKDD